MPLVSVVVPIYNVENYLNRCIESIVNQTYKNLEIILVDDGSTDNSSFICDEWCTKDNRITVIHKENAGAGLARNSGIEKAVGEYIFFFDSDDYIDCNTVKKCVKNAIQNKSDVVVFGRKEVLENGSEKTVEFFPKEKNFHGDEIHNALLPKMFSHKCGFGLSCCSKMFRLSVINVNNIRFKSEREILSEDSYFLLELFPKIKTLSILPEYLYFYCERSSSFSHTYTKDKQKNNDVFLGECIKYVKENNLNKKIIPHMMARYHTYSITVMKEILTSNLTENEKKEKLFNIFDNRFFRNTLKYSAFKNENFKIQIFLISIKFRFYFLSLNILSYKVQHKH